MPPIKPFVGLFSLAMAGLLLCGPAFADETAWELKKDAEGIQVYTRKVEGSPIKEFKGIMVAKIPLDRVIAVFEDTPSACEWMHNCEEFKQLEEKSPDERIFYLHQKLQWPVSDRDVVTYRIRKQDPQTKAVSYTFSEVPGLYPLQKDRVRMLFIRTLWRFTPREDGKVEVYYQVHLDPGGKIPKWVVNQLSVDVPFYTLERFRKFLQSE